MSDEIDVEEIVCPLCNKDVLYCECSESRLYDAINALRQQLSAAQAQAEAMKKRLDVAMLAINRYAEMEQYTYYTIARDAKVEIAALEEGDQ